MSRYSLDSADPTTRSLAANELGDSEDPAAIERLTIALADPDLHVRAAAAKALGSIGDARSLQPLLALLRHDAMEWFHGGFPRDAAEEALAKIGEPAVEPLVAMLSGQTSERHSAALILGRISDKRAVEPLIAMLDDPDDNVRRVAAEGLGKIGDERAVIPLIAALDTDADAAAAALGEIGDRRAIEPLFEKFEHASHPCMELAEALQRLGDERPVEHLLTLLGSQFLETRRSATEMLAREDPVDGITLFATLTL